jgi:hypothetical protein
MSSESKDFDHYAIVLADLKAKRRQIDQAIAAIEALHTNTPIKQVMGNATDPVGENDSQNDFLGMSISEATKKLLKTRRKQMTNSEILAALQAGGLVMTSADPLNTVGAIITRRYKEVGDIVKVARGTWGLKEWYPGRSFNKPLKGNGEGEGKPVSSETNQSLGTSTED